MLMPVLLRLCPRPLPNNNNFLPRERQLVVDHGTVAGSARQAPPQASGSPFSATKFCSAAALIFGLWVSDGTAASTSGILPAVNPTTINRRRKLMFAGNHPGSTDFFTVTCG
jgi:hypothetical protein